MVTMLMISSFPAAIIGITGKRPAARRILSSFQVMAKRFTPIEFRRNHHVCHLDAVTPDVFNHRVAGNGAAVDKGNAVFGKEPFGGIEDKQDTGREFCVSLVIGNLVEPRLVAFDDGVGDGDGFSIKRQLPEAELPGGGEKLAGAP